MITLAKIGQFRNCLDGNKGEPAQLAWEKYYWRPCKPVELNSYISQGSAATDLGEGDSFNLGTADPFWK